MKTTNRKQPKSAKTLGFRFSFNREQPPATVGFVTESVTGEEARTGVAVGDCRAESRRDSTEPSEEARNIPKPRDSSWVLLSESVEEATHCHLDLPIDDRGVPPPLETRAL